jgi:hypothetical protein
MKFVTSNSKQMINLMQVDNEEALDEGIANMMDVLQEEEEEPVVVRKAQAPAQGKRLQQNSHSAETKALLHPLSIAHEHSDG